MPGDDLETLREAREEARATLDHQSALFRRLDRKAVRLLQFDVTLLTVLASVLTATSAAALANLYVLAGVLSVLGSALFAGVTYTSGAQYGGVGARGLDATVRREYDPALFEARAVAGYADWIRRNRRTNARKAPLVTAALLLVVVGASLLLLGTFHGLAGPLSPLALVGEAVFLAVALAASRLPRQVRRWYRLRKREPRTDADVPPFRGELVTTGDGDEAAWLEE